MGSNPTPRISLAAVKIPIWNGSHIKAYLRFLRTLLGMTKARVKKFGAPDEVRNFDKGKLQLVKISGAIIGRGVFEPGWKWSKHVKPIAKTKSCEAPHFQYHVTGILHVKMDDGTEMDIGPGEVSMLPPGHDAWVVGVEPVTVIDFQGMAEYAKGSKK